MTAATARVDGRSTDVITLPRASVEQSWMDVQALTFEARRSLAAAYVAEKRGTDPVAEMIAADRRLVQLDQYARRHAAEAAGITFIDTNQLALPLVDGCLDGADGERGA